MRRIQGVHRSCESHDIGKLLIGTALFEHRRIAVDLPRLFVVLQRSSIDQLARRVGQPCHWTRSSRRWFAFSRRPLCSLGGWATLTGKYNAGLSFNIHRNNWGCATSRVREVARRTADTVRLRLSGRVRRSRGFFETWGAAENSRTADTICRRIPPSKGTLDRDACPTQNELCNNYSVTLTHLCLFNHTRP